MITGIKHLVTCRCVLPQFKRAPSPPQHQFVVFSILDDDVVRAKFVQCNNCGIVHKVTDVCRSEVVARESMGSLVTIDDVRSCLPIDLVRILEASQAELSTWENAQFIIDNQQWGSFIVLATDEEAGLRQGKYVRILGANMFKVDSFAREEIIK